MKKLPIPPAFPKVCTTLIDMRCYNPKVFGFADFETFHKADYERMGVDIRVEGNGLVGEKDGREVDIRTYATCCGLIVNNRKGYRKEYGFTEDPVKELLKAVYEEKVDRLYFHNLRFDQSFISYRLLKEGAIYLGGGVSVSVGKYTMGRQKAIYEMALEYEYEGPRGGTKKFTCRVWDSAKIWASSLRSLGDAFGMEKGDDALTPTVKKNGEVDKEALGKVLDYCIQDCRIVETAMITYMDMISECTAGRIKSGYMTAAGTAYGLGMDWLRACCDPSEVKRLLPECTKENGFPEWFRLGYKGAVPLLDRSKVGVMMESVKVYDVNSMYPYQMMDAKLPVGLPVPCTEELRNGEDMKGWIWVAKVKIMATVKEGHRATYLHKGMVNGEVLATVLDGTSEEVIDSTTLEMLLRDYDIDWIEYIDAVKFRYKRGLFKGFIEHWYAIKKGKKGAWRALAKLVLNSFYGKFGANPMVESYEWEYNGVEDKLKTKELGEEESKKHLYLPIAIFTTSNARNLISRGCEALGWDNVVYTDTDSLHVCGLSKEECEDRFHSMGIGTTSTELGDFKFEGESAYGVYVRNKGYIHFENDGRMESIAMAGANKFNAITVENWEGMKGWQTRGFMVPGGYFLFEKEVDLTKDMMKSRIRTKAKVGI